MPLRAAFIAAASTSALLASFAAFAWWVLLHKKPDFPLPPLLCRAVDADPLPSWAGEEAFRRQWQSCGPPEFHTGLQREFPPGSEERLLVEALRQQGFRGFHALGRDLGIRSARFSQKGGSLRYLPLIADVDWKSEDGVLLWVEGRVGYIGL